MEDVSEEGHTRWVRGGAHLRLGGKVEAVVRPCREDPTPVLGALGDAVVVAPVQISPFNSISNQ